MSNIKTLQEEISTLTSQINTASRHREKLRSELKEVCTHEDSVITTNKYYSGGYDYCASTTYTYSCTVCGAYETEVEQHKGSYA